MRKGGRKNKREKLGEEGREEDKRKGGEYHNRSAGYK
jgi:hypothetical protein